jgi:arylsulfatase A-like enzyme
VLGILGVEAPDRVLGRNVWPRMRSENEVPDYVVSAFGACASIRTADWNYVCPWTEVSEPCRELYDLKADPEELTNVFDQHRDAAKNLSRRLDEHLKKFAPLTGGTFQGTGRPEGQISFDALPRLDD